ncbi:hypothetical protein CEXT_57511 [Caerostris extrusa]|uniref:Uncharacterized protein n=1 Tax=Caerostris extrusa TaxID=172846 RepID=A0AAV4NS96_CAEEX|nr:hypothetical protein CEXT_57511 [Caerostris extrusa]
MMYLMPKSMNGLEFGHVNCGLIDKVVYFIPLFENNYCASSLIIYFWTVGVNREPSFFFLKVTPFYFDLFPQGGSIEGLSSISENLIFGDYLKRTTFKLRSKSENERDEKKGGNPFPYQTEISFSKTGQIKATTEPGGTAPKHGQLNG